METSFPRLKLLFTARMFLFFLCKKYCVQRKCSKKIKKLIKQCFTKLRKAIVDKHKLRTSTKFTYTLHMLHFLQMFINEVINIVNRFATSYVGRGKLRSIKCEQEFHSKLSRRRREIASCNLKLNLLLMWRHHWVNICSLLHKLDTKFYRKWNS